jgi:acyl-coenzyme A thioesterase PaaI-like protein
VADYFQDLMQDNYCWGCGTLNTSGLHLKSEWSIPGEESISTFMPSPEHMAGPMDVVNGGILGALIDCQGIGVAVAREYYAEGREIGQGEKIWCVTGTLTVKYLKPTPINQPIELTARVVNTNGRRTTIECTVMSGGVKTAEGNVVAFRVEPEWTGA